ncbi:MAG: VOC family protein [Candidatus Dormibacteraeota bacterium]|nr:VOC family protein [Candidatus Dormibacteraeota bacterium]
MADATTSVASKPVWVDLSTSDAAGAREFYSKLFSWDVEINSDPQYGGYALARVDGQDVAGIGPKMSEQAPTAWSVYIGTPDAEELAGNVQAAGGNVIAPPFDVGDQGRMAVFQDPSGAFISAWQRKAMGGFHTNAPNTFGWAELNSRGIEKAVPFYRAVFGWTDKRSDMGEGQAPYIEFQLGGESIAGGMEMNSMVPAEVPSYWMVYFGVEDVDRSFKQATESGGREMLAPMDFPGGRFAIVSDPQGAVFGLLKMQAR